MALAAASSPMSVSVEVPYDFQDPITHELMTDPVLLVETGHTYNRLSIQQWFQKGNRTCPKTNRKLKSLLVAVRLPCVLTASRGQRGRTRAERHGGGARRHGAVVPCGG
jgi:hypothetical protein